MTDRQNRAWAAEARLAQLPRPLDPVRSIRVKLGVLVAASVVATAILSWYGLVILGWWARITLPVAVLAALAVTQVLARGMTSPLRQMTAAAREMAAGRTPPPVQVTSRDEVGQLARAFTAMAQDLANADAQRRELLANVAHELRTPVAALRAQLENLVDGVRDTDPAVLAELLDQVERLGVLVDDLLGLARAEAGVTPLMRRHIVLADLVESVVREVGAIRPETRLITKIPPELRIDADPGRLRQVVVNLVENATRHAASQVEVSAVTTEDGDVVLDVADDGPGIPTEERDAVFERYRRGPDTLSTGTGLGLAIARWAVALHSGRIGVVPTDTGCKIRVRIPAQAPPVAIGITECQRSELD